MEKDLTVLTSLVAGGVIIISLLAAQCSGSWWPLSRYSQLYSHCSCYSRDARASSEISEDLERAAFFVVLAMFAASFIILYRPI